MKWAALVALVLATPLTWAQAPANDDCANAEVVVPGTLVQGSTIEATGTGISSCGTGDSLDVWYSFTPVTNMEVMIDTWDTDVLDTTLAVYDGCGGTELACNDDSNCGNKSAIRMNVTSGHTYLIRVAGNDGTTGVFGLLVSDLTMVSEGGGAIVFGDPIVKSVVRRKIAKAGGPIYPADVQGVGFSVLTICGMGITSLQGLEACTDLTDLAVPQNQITSIAPLSSLTGLITLDIGGNGVTDISPVSGLTNLQTLKLSGNPIGSLSPLSASYSLQYLDIESCGITDLMYVGGIYSLSSLYASRNRISSVSPLSGQMNLTTLDLSDNRISDTAMLTSIYALAEVHLAGNPITDLSGIVGITAFGAGKYLDVRRTPLGSNALCTQIPDLVGRGATVDYSGTCGGPDSDGDGLQDALETDIGTDPFKMDTDNDGLDDYQEFVTYGTDPLKWDTDGDWASDGHEVLAQTNPLDPASTPTLVEVAFPDPNLEAAIRTAIAKPTGPIYEDPLLFLTNLNADNLNIQDLTGLEHCTNLRSLNLSYNLIADISPLAGLTSLDALYLNNNQITGVSALSGLTALTVLALDYNQIADASPLSSMTRLVHLGLAGNGVASIDALVRLTALQYLDLGSNQIASIDALAGLTALQTLNLDTNQIASIDALAGLAALQSLDLFANQIASIDALAGLTVLQYLGLGANQIASIDALAGLTALQTLYLHSNQIASITPLAGLTALQILSLADNQITSIDALVGLTALQSLELSGNQIASIDALAGLTVLQTLYLHSNQIVSITPLAGLTALQYLDLDSNRIRSVGVLTGLGNLLQLNLSTNPLTDIAPLAANDGLASGDTVDVTVTPLSQDSLCNQIPILQGRGVTVWFTGMCGGADTDGDGLLDDYENAIGTNPNDADSDHDGLTDYQEVVTYGTNPNNWDSDGDGASDKHEVLAATDPLNAASVPVLTEVLFPDANLQASIRAATGIASGPIYEDAVLQLTILIASASNIQDLTGLEHCTNLTEITLNDNRIVDISPLAGITPLQTLYLGQNQIVSVSALSGLGNLRTLGLDTNQIVDASGLTSLPNLQFLDLGGNQIATQESLPNLPGLTSLRLSYNLLTSLSAIQTFVNLLSLEATDNQISDISALAGLTNLQFIDIRGNGLVDATPLLDNGGLGVSDSVYLSNNPLNLASLTAIDTLRSRGVTVEYSDPAIRSVNPTVGPVSGGFTVTIVGERFNEVGTTMVKVMTPGTENLAWATDVAVQPGGSPYGGDETTITCTFPAFTPGACDVVVVNPDGVHAYLYGGFTYGEAAPVVNEQPVSATIAVGGSAEFLVTASGSEPLSYQWRKDGADIPGATDAVCSVSALVGGVSPRGSYECFVSNPFGNALSDPATLTLDTTGYIIGTLLPSEGGHAELDGVAVPPGEYILVANVPAMGTAVPDSGYAFVAWRDALGTTVGTNNPHEFMYTSDFTLGPVFQLIWFFLTTGVQGQGTVDPQTGEYAPGSTVTLTATPSLDWWFDRWVDESGNLVGTNNPMDVTMTSNRVVAAIFHRGNALVFPDANFEAAVREVTKIPSGPIYPSDVETVGSLDVSGRSIVSLEGIQAFAALAILTASNNSIADASPLSNLAALDALTLNSNSLTDASLPALAAIPNLEGLSLLGNAVHDLTALNGSSHLEWLVVTQTGLDDATPALNIPSLQTLHCSGTAIHSLALVANMTQLSGLYAVDCPLTDISAVVGLTNLTLLDLSNDHIADITVLLDNAGVGAGDQIFLTGNPLNQASIAATDTLRTRGAYVEYANPIVQGIEPNHGPVSGGTSVTITGLQFNDTGTTTVTFKRASTEESADATNVQVQPGGSPYGGDETTITCMTPPFTAGVCDVLVVNPDGSSGMLANAFTFEGLGPAITQQPVSQTVAQGSPVSFSVTATGTPPLSYQWSKDGDTLADATTDTLSIPAVQPSHVGSYLCTVSDVHGSVQSDSVTLQISGQIKYQLTLARTGSGTLWPSQGAHLYDPNTSVDITATPIPGWRFDHWEGPVQSTTANPTQVFMDADKAVTAIFVRSQYILTIAVKGSGTVSPAAGQHLYDMNAAISLTATARPGWIFDRWDGQVQDATANPTQVLVDADKTVTAEFLPTALLTLAKEGSGQVLPFEGTQAVKQGSEVSIEAVPSDGWQFKRWDGVVANALSAASAIQVLYDTQATAIFAPEAQAGEVTGVVKDARRDLPVPEAHVTLFNFESGAVLSETQTDTSGRFTVTTSDVQVVASLHVDKGNYDDYDLPHFQAPIGLNVGLVPAMPDAPGGVVALPGATQILLRWEPNTEPDLAGYHIYRADAATGPFTPLIADLVTQLRYVDESVASGRDYFYVVTAVDAQGNESDYSEVATGRAGQIMIWMPDVNGDAGECIRIPINVANTAGIDPSQLRIELTYDDDFLDPASLHVERTGITADAVVAQDTSVPGTLVITTNQGSVLKGEGHIFDLYACIESGVATGTCANLAFQHVAFSDANGNDVPADFADTAQICATGTCKMGDMDANGAVEMADATVALRIAVKKIVADGCQLTAGDMNGDGLIDCADAVMIQRMAVDRPLNPGVGDQTVRDQQLRVFILDYETGPGGTIDVPIYIDHPEGLSSCDLLVTFPAQSSVLVLSSIDRGSATEDFSLAYEIGNGYARISMSRDDALAASKAGEESLAVLHFTVPDTAPKNSLLPIGLNEVKIAGQFGDDFTWHNNVQTSGGAIAVNSLLCGAAAVSVVNKKDGTPIVNAAIQLAPGPPFALTQNTDGIYVFSCVNTGAAQVNVTATGFKVGTAQVTIQGGTVSTVELSLEEDIPNTGCCGGVLQEVGRTAPPKGSDPAVTAFAVLALATSAVLHRKRARI